MNRYYKQQEVTRLQSTRSPRKSFETVAHLLAAVRKVCEMEYAKLYGEPWTDECRMLLRADWRAEEHDNATVARRRLRTLRDALEDALAFIRESVEGRELTSARLLRRMRGDIARLHNELTAPGRDADMAEDEEKHVIRTEVVRALVQGRRFAKPLTDRQIAMHTLLCGCEPSCTTKDTVATVFSKERKLVQKARTNHSIKREPEPTGAQIDVDAARQRMIERNRNAWKTK